MTSRKLFLFFGFFCLLLTFSISSWLSSAHAETGENSEAPVAFFPSNLFEFQPVLDGTSITHDFIIQNKGNADLSITNVKTG